MRTPVPQTPIAQRELTEQLANDLAQLLVVEYRRRHGQQNQQDPAATVVSPSGLNHRESDPADREDRR